MAKMPTKSPKSKEGKILDGQRLLATKVSRRKSLLLIEISIKHEDTITTIVRDLGGRVQFIDL